LIYVDTNVLIAYINPREKLHSKAHDLLLKYRSDVLAVSQLVILELYSVFSRVMGVSDVEVEALVNYTLNKCGVKNVTVEWDELHSFSLNYANKLKLKTLDLLHVIAAHIMGAKTLITFDKDVVERKNIIKDLLGIVVLGF